jgi:cell division protein FtsN
MSRKKSKSSEPSAFGKLLGWTVVLALVFSAGLITGQRLLRRQAMPPLVSLQTAQRAEAEEPIDTGEERLPTTFSFYDHLADDSSGDEAADDAAEKVDKPGAKAEKKAEAATNDTKPAEKPDPVVNKPASAAAAEAPKESAAEKVIKQVAEVLDDKPSAGKLPARYTLQVGSHTDRAKADRQVEKLESMGLEPHVVMVEVPQRGRFYRVRVGKFHSMEEARNFQGDIQTNRGVSSFVSPI